MTLVPLVAVGTLVFTFVNFLTYLPSKNWNAALTQLIAWVAGVIGIILAAHTQFASQITFGSQKLSTTSWPTQVFLGLIATSLLSTVNEIKKAIDNTDSAKKAPLLPPALDSIRAAQGTPAVANRGAPAATSQAPPAATSQTPPAAANQGVVELVGGAVTVAHPAVRPDSRILLTALGNQQGNLRVTDRRDGSFTITSTNVGDIGSAAYQILGP